ncbi:ras-related protein Rap-2a-like [Littorina saxatilis]|uniref:ras-related protein Rap-2a-like n=1 Tax=Littorina saxatilis TaxID=31220 RepID=UPI0038B6A547
MLPGSQSVSSQLCGDSRNNNMENKTSKPKSNSSSQEQLTLNAKKGKQGDKSRYRIVVMGAAGVGKSAIISQFLYDNFQNEYNQTVEELHQGEYDFNGVKLTLDILDTAGAYSFPAMRQLAISTSDAFVLVYSVDDEASFQAVTELREQIITEKGTEDVPIVIVGNKVDVGDEKRTLGRVTAESIVCVEWGNGYVEASAKDNVNIVGIFKEILRQSKIQYALSPAVRRRRQSTPAALTSQKKKTAARPTRSQRSSCS